MVLSGQFWPQFKDQDSLKLPQEVTDDFVEITGPIFISFTPRLSNTRVERDVIKVEICVLGHRLSWRIFKSIWDTKEDPYSSLEATSWKCEHRSRNRWQEVEHDRIPSACSDHLSLSDQRAMDSKRTSKLNFIKKSINILEGWHNRIAWLILMFLGFHHGDSCECSFEKNIFLADTGTDKRKTPGCVRSSDCLSELFPQTWYWIFILMFFL